MPVVGLHDWQPPLDATGPLELELAQGPLGVRSLQAAQTAPQIPDLGVLRLEEDLDVELERLGDLLEDLAGHQVVLAALQVRDEGLPLPDLERELFGRQVTSPALGSQELPQPGGRCGNDRARLGRNGSASP